MEKTPEEKSAIIKAMLEGKVERGALLTEIRLVLEDFLLGKFEQDENKIYLNLFNGQRFEIFLNET